MSSSRETGFFADPVVERDLELKEKAWGLELDPSGVAEPCTDM